VVDFLVRNNPRAKSAGGTNDVHIGNGQSWDLIRSRLARRERAVSVAHLKGAIHHRARGANYPMQKCKSHLKLAQSEILDGLRGGAEPVLFRLQTQSVFQRPRTPLGE
jgi:hypothetical protein